MTGRRALWAVIVVLLAGFAVAGPAIMIRDASRGAAAGGSEAAAAPPAGGQPIVAMANLAFAPPALQVAAGTTVLWSNQDVAPHTVTTDASDSGLIDPGGSFTMVVAATVSYVCTLHPGMAGTIEVT